MLRKREEQLLRRGVKFVVVITFAILSMDFLVRALGKKTSMVSSSEALPGREQQMSLKGTHAVFKTKLDQEFPGMQMIQLGMGCFWGAEKKYWKMDGVVSTAVGYAGGYTPNPSYEEVCSGRTGHNEVVRVVFDPKKTTLESILKTFWESHNPTQGNRQGNDVGTQYRSAIYYYSDSQKEMVEKSKAVYQERLDAKGYGKITTEIVKAKPFYFAEEYHQQYLNKVPNGYCGMGGTGVSCPLSLGVKAGN